MEITELVRVMLENATHGWELFSSNWDPAKAVPIAFAALSFLWSIYIKWRNSGYRMYDRLEEFLRAQENKIDGARDRISTIVEVPSPARPLDVPAFGLHLLDRILGQINWGYGSASANDLLGAVRLSKQQAELSTRQSKEHRSRQALAHLLLGAREASKNHRDATKRHSARAAALEHFDKAIEINADDCDAIEYSGMMLLELEKADLALQRFDELVELRKKNGGHALSRAYRLQATASEKLAQPKNLNAYGALVRAINALPPEAVLDRALTHEHLAMVSSKLKYTDKVDTNFQAAWSLFNSLRKTAAGQAGMQRVSSKVADLNRTQADGAGQQPVLAAESGGSIAAPLSQGAWSSFFPKGNKPAG